MSFSNTSVAAHSQTLPLLYLCHSSFSNPSFASPTSQQSSFSNLHRHFTFVTTHSPTLQSLYLRHSSFSNPSGALPMSQLILQPFRRFKLRHSSFYNASFASPKSRLFTYVTWRAAYDNLVNFVFFIPYLIQLSR